MPLVDPAAAAAAAEPLLDIAPLLASSMAASVDHVKLGMAVLSSMVLLGGLPFLTTYQQVTVIRLID